MFAISRRYSNHYRENYFCVSFLFYCDRFPFGVLKSVVLEGKGCSGKVCIGMEWTLSEVHQAALNGSTVTAGPMDVRLVNFLAVNPVSRKIHIHRL